MPLLIGENRIALDAASLKRNVDLENAVVNVVPTKGALVLAEFNAHAGARVLMKTSKQGYTAAFWRDSDAGRRTD